jgi:hypothetical protein
MDAVMLSRRKSQQYEAVSHRGQDATNRWTASLTFRNCEDIEKAAKKGDGAKATDEQMRAVLRQIRQKALREAGPGRNRQASGFIAAMHRLDAIVASGRPTSAKPFAAIPTAG